MNYTDWAVTLTDSLTRLIERAVAFLPNILTALALVLVGWILARILRGASARLTNLSLGRLAKGVVLRRGLESTGLTRSVPLVVSRVVFWVVWLFFIAAAIEKLEFTVVRNLLSDLAYYLPRVLLGILVVFVGILAGNLANNAITGSASAAAVRYAQVLGRIVQVGILLVAIIVAADQVGVQSTLLVITVSIVLGTTLGGAALAFGMGSSSTVSNIIAAYYVQKTYRVGQQVRIGDIKGRIVELTPTTVVLESEGRRTSVPAKRFNEDPSTVLSGE